MKIALTELMNRPDRDELMAAGKLSSCGFFLEVPNDAKFPSLGQQLANAAKAAGRVVGAILKSQPVSVPDDVLASREAICGVCPENVAGRCRKCGCGVKGAIGFKTRLATERCPLTPPKWDVYAPLKALEN
jgi:hypothetical protein